MGLAAALGVLAALSAVPVTAFAQTRPRPVSALPT
jgi:hypothetical protein